MLLSRVIAEGYAMIAIRTTFDGEQIVLPEVLRGRPPQEVMLIIDAHEANFQEVASREELLRAQEEAFAKVWLNEQDAAYDEP
jgi:hypothetical protein